MKLDRSYWKRVSIGRAFLWTLDWFFDNPLYIFVLVWLGPFLGGFVMLVLSAIICAILLLAYEHFKTDWLGVNAVEEAKEHGQTWVNRLRSKHIIIRMIAWLPSKLFLLVLWAIKKNDVTAFLALSIYEDAFRATAFLRKGRFEPLKWRDWGIFFASIFVSNVYWIFRNSVIIEIGKALGRFIIGMHGG